MTVASRESTEEVLTMLSLRRITALILFVLLVRVDVALPQASASTAELRGQVLDTQGAAIAGATITVTDVSKGTRRTARSDSNGNYVILALPPAVYEVKAEADGFAASTLSNVRLEVGQVASLPITLNVLGVEAVVEVVAGGDIVEVERTQQSSVIGTTQINNLPINRRNYLDFALLTPGVSDSDNIIDTSDFRVAQTPQSGLSFGGNNGRGNSIMVDGSSADTNSGAARDVVSQEAVQEFQVNRSSYNAEFGGAFGGVVNIVSKSGSNRFSGSIFGYFRDETFDARNAFDFNPDGKSPFNRQQYGGSIGGPIRRDKTFFFTSVERLDQDLTTFVNLLNNPDIFNITASQERLFNELDGTPFAALSAALRATLTTTPQNFPRTVALFEAASGQFPFETGSTLWSARVDHVFNSQTQGYIRFNLADSRFENAAAGALNATSRGRAIDTFTGGVLASLTRFHSPTTINEVRLQWSYLDNDVIPNDPIGPEFNIEGFGNFGRDIFLPSEAIERRYEIGDNLSMVRGVHTFKFGGLYQAINNSTNSQTFFGGRFNFGAAIPLAALIPPATLQQLIGFLNATGRASFVPEVTRPINALQSFNLNLPIVYQQGFGDAAFDSWSHRTGLYAQDTWKIAQNFTLNLGVRYYIEDNHDPIRTYYRNVQPRLGFSWNPFSNGRTVLRGGYGIFTGQVDNQIVNVVNELSGSGDPSNINIVLATATSGALGIPTSIQIYQTLLAQGVIGTRTITASDLLQFGLVPRPGSPLEVRFRASPDYRNPYSQQASLAVQQDLGSGFAVEASYLFSRGAHITRNRDVNQLRLTGPINPFSGVPCFVRFPGAFPSTSGCPGVGVGTDFRNPLILQDNIYESTANSFYHAGTVQLTKRFSNWYSVNANYTWAKTIDEVTDFNSDFSAQNSLNLRADRALSAFDQRHRFVLNAVLQSPLQGESALERIFGDWVFSPIFIAGSGRPFNLLLGFDANNDGRSQSDRPAQAGRNTGRGPDFYSVDIRLARRFFVREARYLEFTFEAFNLFNRTNFIGVNNVVGTSCVANFSPTCEGATFVIPIDARGIEGRTPTDPLGFTAAAASRQLQFGVRYNF